MISLEEMCLNKIAEEFDRFYFVNTMSDDPILNRNFQFLKRTYASELMSKLSQKKKMKDEYLEIFLNVNLKVLDAEWFTATYCQNNVQDIINRLPNLSKIILPTNCSDEILEKIAEFCPQITEIDASRSPVTDTGLKQLCKHENGNIPCPKLKKISISSSRVTEEGLVYLIQNLPSLEEIDNNSMPHILYFLHKADLNNFEKLPTYNLVNLNLRNYLKLPHYNDLLKICLTVCPKLKSIICHILEKEQLDLFNSTNLENLDLNFSNQKIDINNFVRFKGYNLVSLKVHNCLMSISATAENCPKLRHLLIDNVTFLEDRDNPQANFRCLIECTIKKTTDDYATNKAMGVLLSSSPKLEQLTFHSCDLSAETKAHFLKCCENCLLKEITFLFMPTGIQILKHIILSCPSLKTLKFVCLFFNPYDFTPLTDFVKKLPNKPNIYVNDLYISDYNEDYRERMANYY